MINNIGAISKKYKCGGILGNYLVYVGHLPLLGIKGKWFYFTDNEKLRKILKGIPLWLKIIRKF